MVTETVSCVTVEQVDRSGHSVNTHRQRDHQQCLRSSGSSQGLRTLRSFHCSEDPQAGWALSSGARTVANLASLAHRVGTGPCGWRQASEGTDVQGLTQPGSEAACGRGHATCSWATWERRLQGQHTVGHQKGWQQCTDMDSFMKATLEPEGNPSNPRSSLKSW